jgi:hypothetical protein
VVEGTGSPVVEEVVAVDLEHLSEEQVEQVQMQEVQEQDMLALEMLVVLLLVVEHIQHLFQLHTLIKILDLVEVDLQLLDLAYMVVLVVPVSSSSHILHKNINN